MDEAKEIAIAILDVFENFLDEKNIQIPNVDRDEYEQESQTTGAILFGSDYYRLEEDIKNILGETYGLSNDKK